MSKVFKMNCKEVYDAGEKYYSLKEEIESIQKELMSISEGVSNAWKGGDSYNFNMNLNGHIKDYDVVINYLENKHEVLNKNSTGHSNIDTEFQEKMKRDELYE